VRVLPAAALIISGIAPLGAVPADNVEVVIADYLDWANYPAFYVDAPSQSRPAMTLAVTTAVKGAEIECIAHESCSWLRLAGKLRFFRAVSGSGKALRGGMVCPDADWLPHQRYYQEKFLVVDCIRLRWDFEMHRYKLVALTATPNNRFERSRGRVFVEPLREWMIRINYLRFAPTQPRVAQPHR
jgi:hypothetical protein